MRNVLLSFLLFPGNKHFQTSQGAELRTQKRSDISEECRGGIQPPPLLLCPLLIAPVQEICKPVAKTKAHKLQRKGKREM